MRRAASCILKHAFMKVSTAFKCHYSLYYIKLLAWYFMVASAERFTTVWNWGNYVIFRHKDSEKSERSRSDCYASTPVPHRRTLDSYYCQWFKKPYFMSPSNKQYIQGNQLQKKGVILYTWWQGNSSREIMSKLAVIEIIEIIGSPPPCGKIAT